MIREERSEDNLNLVQIFWHRANYFGHRPVFYFKDKKDASYKSISWNECSDRVKHTALGLYALGIRKGDRVALLSENRPEWAIADFGILSLGAITVPIYPTSSPQEISYLIENAGIEFIFVSNSSQVEKLKGPDSMINRLRQLVIFEPGPQSCEEAITFGELWERGRRAALNNSGLYDDQVNAVEPRDAATIIYTSGTTGPPKGVVLTHRNFIANYLGARAFIPLSPEDLALSFLPLSHVFERLAGYYFMIARGASIAYAESMQTVGDDLLTVRPTVASAVPRFFEKMYANILEKVNTGSRLRQKIFWWAVAVGRLVGRRRVAGRDLSAALHLQYLVSRLLVFNKIRSQLGGRIRFFISGGAPLSKELAEFFYAVGVLILEGYGLTETSPVISVNAPGRFKFGTVGRILPNVEIKIAEDGEILTRGPCVMEGYYKNESATAEAMEGGWFHTGDIGLLDSDGFLKITDRKKDIIVTSGGKNISPQNIENLVLSDPLFRQIVVIGDKRNYLVALIALNPLEVRRYAQAHELGHLAGDELLNHPGVYRWAEERLREKTRDLAVYEQIKYFAVLKQELELASGELTPTLKTKRKVVMNKYQDLIEGLYRRGEEMNPKSSPASVRR